MKSSDRITVIAVMMALAYRQDSLPPEWQPPSASDYPGWAKFGQENLGEMYTRVREILQTQAAQRGKGDLPIIPVSDNQQPSILMNHVTQLEDQEDSFLENSWKAIIQAEDRVKEAKSQFTQITGFLW